MGKKKSDLLSEAAQWAQQHVHVERRTDASIVCHILLGQVDRAPHGEDMINHFDPFGQDLGLLKSLEEEVVSELEELSRRLMNGLFVLIRSAWLYGLENDTKNCAEFIQQIFGDYESRGQEVVNPVCATRVSSSMASL